jgi:hypothetical protein
MHPVRDGNDVVVSRPIDTAWVATACLVPVIVGLLTRMSTTDLTYHLRAGADILHGSIPRVDTYTFSVPGVAWTDQQWGAQALMTLIYKLGGWPTLSAAQGLLMGGTFGLVYLAARESGATRRTASLLTIAGFLASVAGLAMRPQLLALPLFALLLWVVAARARHPERLWLAPVLTAVCVNVHGSFPLFIVVLLLAWLDDRRRHSDDARRSLMVTAISLAATLLNPFGPQAWGYVIGLSTNPVIRTTISEWEPTTLDSLPGWLTVGSALAVAAILIVRRRPVPWTALITFGGFFLLALSAQRAIIWWGIVAPVALAGVLAPAPDIETEGSPDEARGNGPARVMIAALVAVIVILAPWFRGSRPSTFLTQAPPGLTDAVRALPAGSRLMVHQPWGSWFEFAVPDDPVFVDSRIEIVPKAIWKDYGEVGFAGAGWKEVLERWDVDAIVAAPNWELLPYLRSDPAEWRVAYDGEDGTLFQRVLVR